MKMSCARFVDTLCLQPRTRSQPKTRFSSAMSVTRSTISFAIAAPRRQKKNGFVKSATPLSRNGAKFLRRYPLQSASHNSNRQDLHLEKRRRISKTRLDALDEGLGQTVRRAINEESDDVLWRWLRTRLRLKQIKQEIKIRIRGVQTLHKKDKVQLQGKTRFLGYAEAQMARLDSTIVSLSNAIQQV